MTERVEEIRRIREEEKRTPLSAGQLWFGAEVDILLTALAQAELERGELEERMACQAHQSALDRQSLIEARAEVERLKAESAEKGRWSAHWHGEMLQREADLARTRAALDRKHVCVFEACCNDAVRAALEGRG